MMLCGMTIKNKAESIPSDTKAALCASLESSPRCFLPEKTIENTKYETAARHFN